jgi:hypothetical protein
MASQLVESLEQFQSPRDEDQLRLLERTIASVRPQDCGEPEFRALLSVFERFPAEDGFGVFWSIVHFLEACEGYEPALLESVRVAPTEFNVLMVNRILNAGIAQVAGESLLSVLNGVASDEAAPDDVRESARDFIEHQRTLGNAEA